jgi:hypothetical protein
MIHIVWPSAKAAAVVKAVLPLLTPQLQQRLQGWERRKHFKRAVLQAFDEFGRDPNHREFASSFFDGRFLTGFAAPLLARFLTERGKRTEPAELARAWQAHYHMPLDSIPGATAAAERFLYLLEERLLADSLFDAILNNRVIDETALATRETQQQVEALDRRIRNQEAREMFKLLLAAARSYEQAARARREGSDAEGAEENAEAYFDNAIMDLRAVQSPSVAELEALFAALVSDRYEALCVAVQNGQPTDQEYRSLEDGVESLRLRLRELSAAGAS